MNRMETLAQELAQLQLQIKHDMEHAEAKVVQVNNLLQELGKTGLLKETVMLGRCRHIAYPAESQTEDPESEKQAALLIPEGFGICSWNAGDLGTSRREDDGGEAEVRKRFVPFAQCNTAGKAFLLPFIEDLLQELMDVAEVAASQFEGGEKLSAEDYFAKRRTRE